MLMNEIKRDTFPTGAQRDSEEGKGRYDLISPIAIRELALVLERGASRNGDRNWEKGIRIGRSLSSAKRHIDQYIEGHRDEPHLSHAFTNLMFCIHTIEMIERGLLPRELNDTPDYTVREKSPSEILYPEKSR